MANTILIKQSSTASDVPTAGQMETGELAVNTNDQKLYSKDATTVFELGAKSLAEVTAVGASTAVASTFSGGLNLSDSDLNRPVLEDYAVKHQTATVSANAVTVNLTLGNSATIDMDPATAAVALTLSNPPASGRYGEVNLTIIMGTPAYGITWPGTITWLNGGTEPTLTTVNNTVDIVHLYTLDAGTTWYGTFALAAGPDTGTLTGLTDTTITSPADAALLLYDTGTSKWRDATMSGDATITDTGVITVANHLPLTGGTLTGALSIDTDTVGPMLSIGDATGADGDSLLKFATDRPWDFIQSGTGAASKLVLRSLNDKNFLIFDSVDATQFTFATGTGNFTAAGDIAGSNLSGSNTGDNAGVTNVNDGNGMTFTAITGTGDVVMGTPGSITDTSTNSVSTNSHTHAVSHTGTGNFAMAASPTFTGTVTLAALTTTGVINLGHASDTTIARNAAGKVEIENKPIIKHASTTYESGEVTFSTSAASGGSNGDIWYKYT